jgi:hypothetical protein
MTNNHQRRLSLAVACAAAIISTQASAVAFFHSFETTNPLNSPGVNFAVRGQWGAETTFDAHGNGIQGDRTYTAFHGSTFLRLDDPLAVDTGGARLNPSQAFNLAPILNVNTLDPTGPGVPPAPQQGLYADGSNRVNRASRGAVLSREFVIDAGETLNFRWAFTGYDFMNPSYGNDFALLGIGDMTTTGCTSVVTSVSIAPTAGVCYLLTDIWTAGTRQGQGGLIPYPHTPRASETSQPNDWLNFNLEFASSYTGEISWVIANGWYPGAAITERDLNPSALLLDRIRVFDAVPPDEIPLPSSLLLCLGGLAALRGAVRCRPSR